MTPEVDYLANIRLPTEKAHGVQILKMCEAFTHAGVNLRLIVSARKSSITEDPFHYYGIAEKFPIARAWTLDTVSLGAWGFRLQSFTFALATRSSVRKSALLYGRDEMVLWMASLFRKNPVVWESHTGAWNFFARAVAKRAKSIVVISQGLQEFYIGRGVAKNKIVVAHDGIDFSLFSHTESKGAARMRLGLPRDEKIAMYIGRLDGWKGVGTLLEASAFFANDTRLVIIGGEPWQISQLREKYPRVLFLGYRPYREIADNQAAADVLVLPNTGRNITSLKFTSPLKLFTYMASGKPIVSSDLPSIREVLSEQEAFLVEPDNVQLLADGVIRALTAPDAPERAMRALAKVAEYTWDKRAKRIRECLL